MSNYLSRKDIEELKPQIERTVHKFSLGSVEHAIISSALNCLDSGYDKRKTTDKLTKLIDDKRASKVAEKVFDIYDAFKSMQRSKKRSHGEDKEKDKDSKKAKMKDDNKSLKDSKDSENKVLSPDKISQMMANARREIEEKKRANAKSQKNNIAPISVSPKLPPLAKNQESLAAVGSMYSQGLLTKNDSDKARKIAALQAAIQNKLKSGLLGNVPVEKPKPLILDESGRTVDITGKEVHLTHVVPTLKANIRAKKREEFKAQLQDSKAPEDFQETHFFDNRIGVKPSVRNKRSLKFHEPGKFVQIGNKLRMKAQLEKLQNEISQIARKTGISSATKLALIAPKTEALNEDVPNMEWWDSVILSGNPADCDDVSKVIKVSTITNLVEHPAQMRPPTDPLKPVFMPVFLTKKERKKLRRQTRREAWKEEQEKIRIGLVPPPEPKLRISNLMRVLGTEAVQDPTKIEQHVRQQMAKRLKAHEDANAARRLTVEQKREKKARKIKEDTSLGVHVAVYRIRELNNFAAKKFKIEANAKQLYLTGCVMIYQDCNVVIVEGGTKQLSKYKRVMLNRIKWEKDVVQDSEGKAVPNKCVLIWEGTCKQRHFGEIKFKVCPMEKMAREHFKKHQVEHYWDLAYSGAVLDNTEEITV